MIGVQSGHKCFDSFSHNTSGCYGKGKNFSSICWWEAEWEAEWEALGRAQESVGIGPRGPKFPSGSSGLDT